MKRYGNLFERVVEYGNLEQAFHNAARHKTRRSEVIEYGSHLEANLLQLQRELITGTYRTSEYKTFIIYEPKERKIFKLPFRDRVVHWAIMQVIEPIWLSNFTRDTYSCIRGRGIHPLLYKLRRDLKADPEGTRYCLKIDVRKFYPSIDHEIMKQVIRRKLKDARLLALLDGIVDSAENGVPIGNYLSQFFANLYLSELDHIMKEEMGIRYYYRFADDIVLLDGNKEKLHGTLVFINHYLNNERALSIKPNYQVFPVESRGVNYVGYVTFHDYCLARKQNKKNLCREVAKLRKRGMSDEEIRAIRERVSPELELEVFCHGAMCVSYSGRCLLSNYMTGRDSNRGACAQPCRYQYALMEEKRPGEYFPVFEVEQGNPPERLRDKSLQVQG